jgi:hypothetical protein
VTCGQGHRGLTNIAPRGGLEQLRQCRPFDDLKPVKKFTDRKAAVARIWKAVQRLARDVAPPATPVATERTRSKKSPAKAPRRPRTQKGATESRTNKKAEVIAMMKRAKGVKLDEIMEATGWQKHSVRGFVSILGSKGGEKIESSKNAAGERTYRIAKLPASFSLPQNAALGYPLVAAFLLVSCLNSS